MNMSYHAVSDGSGDIKADRLIHRLSTVASVTEGERDPEVAPLLPSFQFGQRLMSGLTPIERDGLLDFAIERPKGLSGWTLLLTVRGSGELLDHSQSVELRKGDVLLVPPRAQHHYRRHPESDSWWHRWVYFQPRQTWLPWLTWKGTSGKSTVLKACDDDLFRELNRVFTEIDGWSMNSDSFSLEMSFNLLERAVLVCSRFNEKPVAEFDPRLASVCAYILENIDKPLTLEDFAAFSCLSISRLSHLFRAQYGCGIIAWRDDLRMQLACRILRMTDAPIKQIAIKVGYCDQLYFSKMFKNKIGKSPTEYRRSYLPDDLGEGI